MTLSTELIEQLELTLSYFEPMSLEMIYIDLDKEFLMNNKNLTIEDLQTALKSLEKSKKVKKLKKNKESYWLRIYPKKTIWKKFKNLFR